MLEDIASDEAHLDNLRAEAEKLHGLVESLLQRKVCLASGGRLLFSLHYATAYLHLQITTSAACC